MHVNEYLFLQKYDKDGSGLIGFDELFCILQDAGLLCTREEAMIMFSHVDSDGAGSIDFAEFISWWEKSPSMF